MTAREAVQTAEDARLITLKRQEEERLAAERAAAAEREAQAKAETDRAKSEADEAAQARARAEAEATAVRVQAERAKQEARYLQSSAPRWIRKPR